MQLSRWCGIKSHVLIKKDIVYRNLRQVKVKSLAINEWHTNKVITSYKLKWDQIWIPSYLRSKLIFKISFPTSFYIPRCMTNFPTTKKDWYRMIIVWIESRGPELTTFVYIFTRCYWIYNKPRFDPLFGDIRLKADTYNNNNYYFIIITKDLSFYLYYTDFLFFQYVVLLFIRAGVWLN